MTERWLSGASVVYGIAVSALVAGWLLWRIPGTATGAEMGVAAVLAFVGSTVNMKRRLAARLREKSDALAVAVTWLVVGGIILGLRQYQSGVAATVFGVLFFLGAVLGEFAVIEAVRHARSVNARGQQ